MKQVERIDKILRRAFGHSSGAKFIRSVSEEIDAALAKARGGQ